MQRGGWFAPVPLLAALAPVPVRRDAGAAAAGGAASDRCRRREHSAARVRGVRFASSGEARFRHPQRFTVRTSARFRFVVMPFDRFQAKSFLTFKSEKIFSF